MNHPDDTNQPFDLLLQAGRIVCPHNGWDGPGRLAIRGDRIAAVEFASPGRSGAPRGDALAQAAAQRTIDLPDSLLLPGLIDLHAHPGVGQQWLHGVQPDRGMLPAGVTTVMSQGDAGAANLEAYVEQTIRPSRVRVLLAVNLGRDGERAGGALARLEDADVEACVQAVARHPQHIWGIAVNASHHACGSTDPRLVVRRGLEAAQRTGLPLLYGLRRPQDWPLEQQLALLRAGDVVTYCFRRQPHCIVDLDRRSVLSPVVEARRRGVRFDVGHGTASFDFEVAAAAIADGFAPDTISTDLQRRHLDPRPAGVRGAGPPQVDYESLPARHSLPRVMAKLRAAGMSAADVLAAATSRPAAVLGRADEIGTLTPGACADLVALRAGDEPQILTDPAGGQRRAPLWHVTLVVRNGQHVVV